jgi:hypothetical protein
MSLRAAFEDDLERWLGTVYERVALLERRQGQRAVERVVERQNRVYLGLIAVLAASIMLLPLLGPPGVLGGLLLLYGGALVSSLITAYWLRRFERRETTSAAARLRTAQAQRPVLAVDDRARLIRIMNLSGLRPSRGVRAALAAELAEARQTPGLRSWPAVYDAGALLEEIQPLDSDD